MRRAIGNSKTVPGSSAQAVLVAAALALWSACAVWVCFTHGWITWYGDAEAHLNTARRIVESRTPGYEQLGTPWLPILHVLLLPFVRVDAWWHNGIAAAIPSAACFVAGGTFLFLAVRRIFESTAAALTATALAALNPNLMYLQSTSMTEGVFFGAFMALFYFTVRGSAVGAGLAAIAASLTRFDGWFLIPFVALFIWMKRGPRAAVVFSMIAAGGPLYWMGHNWYMTGDAIDFLRGPSSAKAIQGAADYPGKENWRLAFLYYRAAVGAVSGLPLVVLGLFGLLWGRHSVPARFGAVTAHLPHILLALPPIFYIWSVHSSGLPIFVPQFWPYGHYNTRYGLSALPLLAFGGAALLAAIPLRFRARAAVLAVAAATLPWLLHPSPGSWITWAESLRNSEQRRAWTREAADFLSPRYVRGSGIITSFGDLTGIYRQMNIPLRETFTVCDGLPWEAAVRRPDLFLTEEWAVVARGDQVDRALALAKKMGVRYSLEKTIVKKNEPVIEIYRRQGGLHGPP